ncbi:hypothetical protein AAG906_015521 [Vitis piasezkii]
MEVFKSSNILYEKPMKPPWDRIRFQHYLWAHSTTIIRLDHTTNIATGGKIGRKVGGKINPYTYTCDKSEKSMFDIYALHQEVDPMALCYFILSSLVPQNSPNTVCRYVLFPERFSCKDQKSAKIFMSGFSIGLLFNVPLIHFQRAFYFSDEFLTSLFKENGFDVEELGFCCKQVENRSREIVMNRRWLQAVFHFSDGLKSSYTESAIKFDLCQGNVEPISSSRNSDQLCRSEENSAKELANDFEVDMSEGMAFEMFGISHSSDEIIEVDAGNWNFKIKVLSKNTNTCKSTGLMLWESARLMASVLAQNPTVVAGKRVLELGCGCGGICSMVSARSADFVVATDGDAKALDMLAENVASNLQKPFLDKLITKRLEWGNRDHIEAIKELNDEGFEVIIGTDVTYIPEAILPLFATAKELISSNRDAREIWKPALILCHVLRRVDEPSILSAASKFGFRLVDKWPTSIPTSSSQSIISSWFLEKSSEECIPTTALNIMYFHSE